MAAAVRRRSREPCAIGEDGDWTKKIADLTSKHGDFCNKHGDFWWFNQGKCSKIGIY